MKKLMVMVLAMLLVPAAAMGFQKMSDQAQSEVTGQAGVQIAVDDVKMYQNIGGLWYTDTDGLDSDTTTGGASVGISGLTANVLVEAIYESSGGSSIASPDGTAGIAELEYSDMSTAVQNGLSSGSIDPLTIDVTSDLNMISGAGIHIQLPSIAIQQDSLSMSLSVYNDKDPLKETGSFSSFGKVHVGDTTMAITDGTVEIAPN